MAFTKAQVVLANTSGLPADDMINTWHFVTSSNNSINGAEISLRLEQFYTQTASGTGQTISEFLGNCLSRASQAVEVRLYDEAANNLPPYYTDTFTLGAVTETVDLPWEVASCLSFRNDSVTSYPARNRRGRVFLGPLNILARTETGASVRPSSTFIDTVLGRAEVLSDADDAAVGWVIWSPTLGQSFPVEVGWMDNAFDTQRRRGEAPTARTTVTF